MHVRVCRECDTEFLPHVERCSDCGGPLEDQHVSDDDAEAEDGSPRAAAWATGGLPPGEYLPLVQRDQAAALDPLAERLAEAGLPYRVDVRPGFGFELRVRREEHDAALVALNDLLGPLDAGGADGFDGEGGGYAQCPACESALPVGARECPECGLELGGEQAPRCTNCNGELSESLVCPRCEPQAAG